MLQVEQGLTELDSEELVRIEDTQVGKTCQTGNLSDVLRLSLFNSCFHKTGTCMERHSVGF